MFKNRYITIFIFVTSLVLTSVLTVFGGIVVDVVSSFGKEKPEVVPASYPRLAANLQNELNGAMSPEFPFDFETAGNPFADKTGVSLAVGENKSQLAGTNTPGQSSISALRNGGNPSMGAPVIFPVRNFGQVQPGTTLNPNVVQTQGLESDAKQLLAERNRQIRQGSEVGDLSDIYSINDVRPIGVIGSGNKNRVWLYSPATKQRFTVRKGTRFRDGTIEGVNNEGVEFRRADGTTANVRWMKNKEMSAESDADAPLLRVESPNSPDNAQVQSEPLPNNFPAQTQTVRVRSNQSKRN